MSISFLFRFVADLRVIALDEFDSGNVTTNFFKLSTKQGLEPWTPTFYVVTYRASCVSTGRVIMIKRPEKENEHSLLSILLMSKG